METQLSDLIEQIGEISLSEFENPFIWNLEGRNDKDVVKAFLEKCGRNTTLKLSFKTFVCSLCLAYELHKAGKKLQALKHIKGVEMDLMDEIEDEQLFSSIKDAVNHILYSSMAFIMDDMDKSDEAAQGYSKIIPFANMDKTNQAGLLAIKASAMMEYALNGAKRARHLVEKAISLDPDNVHWHFLKGKILLRIRHIESHHELPSEEELEEFKLCCKGNRYPLYMVYAAEAFRESATYLLRNTREIENPDTVNAIDELNKNASEIYRMCASLENCSTGVLFRCAKGFMKLPSPYNDVRFAKELLDRGLKENNNDIFGRHNMAHYYEKYEKNFEMAIEHLEFCAENYVFGAHMDLVRVNYKLTRDHVPAIEELNRMFEKFKEESYQLEILCQMASTLLFKTDDMPVVIKCIMKVMEINPKCLQIMNHYNSLNLMKNSRSLYDVVISKINDLSKDDSCTLEMKELFDEFTEKVSSLEIPVNATDDLHKTLLRNYGTVQNRGGSRGNPFNRGRGRGRGFERENWRLKSTNAETGEHDSRLSGRSRGTNRGRGRSQRASYNVGRNGNPPSWRSNRSNRDEDQRQTANRVFGDNSNRHV